MKTQLDIFADGSAHSLPPHLDPALVDRCRMRTDVDLDHVGIEAIGRYGNNALVFVFEVIGRDGGVLYAEQFTTAEAAECQMAHHEALIEAHRQTELF